MHEVEMLLAQHFPQFCEPALKPAAAASMLVRVFDAGIGRRASGRKRF